MSRIKCSILFIAIGMAVGCARVSPEDGLAATKATTPKTYVAPSAIPTIKSTPRAEVLATQDICPRIGGRLPLGGIYGGHAILLNYDSYKLLSLDFLTGKLSPLLPDDEQLYSYAFTNDGRWWAYQARNTSTNQERLVVQSEMGTQKITIDWNRDWANIAYWLDDHRLLLKGAGSRIPPLLVLDPFSLEKKSLLTAFPEIYDMQRPPDWNEAGEVSFNSRLDRAVVASSDLSYTLWDIPGDRTLVALQGRPFGQFRTKAPQWSPDGQTVLISAPGAPLTPSASASLDYMNDELYAVDSAGGIKKLTNLVQQFGKVGINRYSWSPDGSHIALLFSSPQSGIEGEQLAVMDYPAGKLDMYCLRGDATTDYRTNPRGTYEPVVYRGVVWSPDSKYLLLENRKSIRSADIIMLDVMGRTAYQVIAGSNLEPVGWITNMP